MVVTRWWYVRALLTALAVRVCVQVDLECWLVVVTRWWYVRVLLTALAVCVCAG